MSYSLKYTCEDLAPQEVVAPGEDLSTLFAVAAQENADAFFANGGKSYDDTDLGYAPCLSASVRNED